MGTKKNFVLDTNVILHDYNCLKNFQENDIYLPLVVLEELDKFKKGNEQINCSFSIFAITNSATWAVLLPLKVISTAGI